MSWTGLGLEVPSLRGEKGVGDGRSSLSALSGATAGRSGQTRRREPAGEDIFTRTASTYRRTCFAIPYWFGRPDNPPAQPFPASGASGFSRGEGRPKSSHPIRIFVKFKQKLQVFLIHLEPVEPANRPMADSKASNARTRLLPSRDMSLHKVPRSEFHARRCGNHGPNGKPVLVRPAPASCPRPLRPNPPLRVKLHTLSQFARTNRVDPVFLRVALFAPIALRSASRSQLDRQAEPHRSLDGHPPDRVHRRFSPRRPERPAWLRERGLAEAINRPLRTFQSSSHSVGIRFPLASLPVQQTTARVFPRWVPPRELGWGSPGQC